MSGLRKTKFGVKQYIVLGLPTDFDKKVWGKIKRTWYWHNAYCYDVTSARYNTYGKIGWKICDEWSCYNVSGLYNFYLWAYKYFNKEEDLSLVLDKDLYDNNLKTIRPESCRWVTNTENVRERNARYKEKQQKIMREIGKRNKGKREHTEKQKIARHNNAVKLNKMRWNNENS